MARGLLPTVSKFLLNTATLVYAESNAVLKLQLAEQRSGDGDRTAFNVYIYYLALYRKNVKFLIS